MDVKKNIKSAPVSCDDKRAVSSIPLPLPYSKRVGLILRLLLQILGNNQAVLMSTKGAREVFHGQ